MMFVAVRHVRNRCKPSAAETCQAKRAVSMWPQSVCWGFALSWAQQPLGTQHEAFRGLPRQQRGHSPPPRTRCSWALTGLAFTVEAGQSPLVLAGLGAAIQR